MSVGNRSQSLGSQVNCSAILAIILKPNFPFCHQSRTIQATDKDRWDRIRVYLCDRNDREGSSAIATNLMKNTSAAIAAIATITAIIRNSKHSDCNDCKDHSDCTCPAILTTPAIIWKSIISDRHDHMETEGGLYFGKGSEKFQYVFTFRFRNYFLGANVPPEIISLDALMRWKYLLK